MVILAMAAFLPDLNPAVLFDHSDRVPDFHWTSLLTCAKEQQGFIGAIVWAIVGSYWQPVVQVERG
jgi:hypothetical protein